MTNGRSIEAARTIHEFGRPHAATSGEDPVTETIYTGEIPAFVDATLERLYASVYCTLTRIEAYDSLNGICTYVRKEGSIITAVLLFRLQGHVVSVINQQITLPAAKISDFCDAIFRTFKRAQLIQFYAMDVSLEQFGRPYQQLPSLEENIIYYPASRDAYLASLRPQFLKQLSQGTAKIKEAHPSFQLHYANRAEINEDDVVQVLELTKKRMLSKGREVYAEKVNRNALVKTLEKYGHVVTATIDEKICAGSIFFSVGKRHFHQYIAHNPEYDQYVLGNQIWLAAILYSLELRGEECWLMGGARLHKSRFRAKPQVFNSLTIYKSKPHAVLNMRILASQWLQQKKSELSSLAKAQVEEKTLAGRWIEKSLAIKDTLQPNKSRFKK